MFGFGKGNKQGTPSTARAALIKMSPYERTREAVSAFLCRVCGTSQMADEDVDAVLKVVWKVIEKHAQ